MTRLTSSTFIALMLTGTGQAQTLQVAKPVSVQAAQVSVSAAPATQLAQGRDGQRTVRVVYAGPIVAR